jgi:hypothetical protein
MGCGGLNYFEYPTTVSNFTFSVCDGGDKQLLVSFCGSGVQGSVTLYNADTQSLLGSKTNLVAHDCRLSDYIFELEDMGAVSEFNVDCVS